MGTIKFQELAVEELSVIYGGVVADLWWLIRKGIDVVDNIL
jgi:hypothetical protein